MSNKIMYATTHQTLQEDMSEEIAKAIRSSAFLREGLKQGFLKFGYACKKDDSQVFSFYCPDKLVWEEIGYFNNKPDEINYDTCVT